jgi:demethylmenaquinone methyltransferase/2-methoxy-6-polyprenyl-1,4-benzoquinol methylase
MQSMEPLGRTEASLGGAGRHPHGPLARLARAPAWLYRRQLGWLLGERFLLITHLGRRTGRARHTVVEVVAHARDTNEYMVVAAWGRRSDWFRNIEAHPAVEIAVGRRRFAPTQRILSEDEALAVLRSYRRRHPLAFRGIAWALGWGTSLSEEDLRRFARGAAVVAFKPASSDRTLRPADSPDVRRPRADAARTYDRLSRVYDLTEGLFERRHQDLGLQALAARPGERVLEIGHGTGRCLAAIARAVGARGRVAGIDLSEGMHRVAKRRLRRMGLADRVDLRVGDALRLPFADGSFDAIFTSFCLELFAAADIPVLLGECCRVLRPGGRMVVVSLASTARPGLMTRVYLLGHARFPRLLDCRPIPVRTLLETAGLRPVHVVRSRLLGLPVAVARATR